ncbi:acyltransferase [Aestuariibaculum sp. YM273]|uniref:acyltransferase n=1 Tax=Aestuariibaculum sp. YM273 TaxID=3070659 RepID=UPI0027DBBD61|nr:acyltransferase [Aestuariibaculum sp. YM273]WMI66630.1 acyltransferase [Aestuariibaculum sp. YM273]
MLNKVYAILVSLRYFGSRLLNRIKLALFKVKVGRNLKINGSLFLKGKGNITFGNHVTINSNYFFNPIGGQTFSSIVVAKQAKLKIGNHVGISNTAIFCSIEIVVEDNVLIGGGCKIWDTDFHSLDKNIRGTEKDNGESIPVKIKKNAFIGGSSIILKGVTIGENSIIGAGSVVTKSVPDNEIWGGNPAKFIRNIKQN